MEKYKGIRFDTDFNRALEICQEEVAKNPDYLVIHYDMESGWPMVISNVQQKQFAEVFEACKPKFDPKLKMGKGLIMFGTPKHNDESFKDLFGENIPRVYFKAVPTKEDNGFMMCACGKSTIDDQTYVVTTNGMHADEVPELCSDAKTFAELVATLLNKYYNENNRKV